MKTSLLLILACFWMTLSAPALQAAAVRHAGPGSYTLIVKVSNDQEEAVPGAAVMVRPAEIWGITDAEGKVRIEQIPYDAASQVAVTVLGYRDFTRDFCPDSTGTTRLDIRIQEESISLQGIVVVAENKKSGESTASHIGRQAIDHLQATSLKDLLQLLPGQVSMSNPTLNSAKYFNSRTLNADDSFGSALVMDGVPLSTNAEMGVRMNSYSTDDRGVDLRTIGTDDIESVEVIRGIPSAEYGDCSSGTMIINSKIGITDLNVRSKIMPGIMQFYAGKGFQAGNLGNINVSADYAQGKSDPRYQTDRYDRLTTSLAHSKNILHGKWYLTTKVNFTYINEWSGPDPEEPEAVQHYYEQSRKYNFMIKHSGKVNLNRRLAGTVKYDLAYTNNTTRIREEDSIMGMGAIFDNAEEGMFEGSPYPDSYETDTAIRSNPVSFYAKLTDLFQLGWGRSRHHFNTGLEFRSDGNNGAGRYDLGQIPTFPASRTRKFSDLPYLTQCTAYAEDRFTLPFSRKEYPQLKGQAGVRYTLIQPGRSEQMSSWSPRINLTLELTRWCSLRTGFGLSDKMPSLQYLYPDPYYFDYYNLAVTNGTRRHYLYSTRIFDLTNPDLEPMKNAKWEAGIDLNPGNGMSFSIVAYREKTRNRFGYDNNRWEAAEFDKWNASDVHYEGDQPVYDRLHPSSREKVLIHVARPANVGTEINQGIEFDFNLGKIRATNTAFYLNGAWNTTRYESQNRTYQRPTGEHNEFGNVYLVYPYGQGSRTEDRRASAALRIVQHIPAINFVVTATGQFVFYDYCYSADLAEKPVGYLTDRHEASAWQEGKGSVQYIPFTPEQLADPDYQFEGYLLKDQIYRRNIANLPTIWPMIWAMNLRVTKEMSGKLGFSFYVNNLLFHQPWQNTNTSTNPVERNSSLFSYGLELYMHF